MLRLFFLFAHWKEDIVHGGGEGGGGGGGGGMGRTVDEELD